MPVLSGIDRVETVDTLLSSGRLGLLTNPSGLTRSLCPTADVLHRKYRLTALFAAEHGIRGNIEAGEAFSAMQDPTTGLPVFPLYGKTKVLTEKMLETFDIFCFDMQDVGARFYTFLYALSLNMEACCRAGKPVVVFDRINPLGGRKDSGHRSGSAVFFVCGPLSPAHPLRIDHRGICPLGEASPGLGRTGASCGSPGGLASEHAPEGNGASLARAFPELPDVPQCPCLCGHLHL